VPSLVPSTLAIALGVAGSVACQAGHGSEPSSLTADRIACDGVIAKRAEGARCYSLPVPENRAAAGRTIALRIAVLPATGTPREPDPVVYLAGGPGQAATSIMDDSPWTRRLREHRDLVFADQRGTGGSHALTCAFYGPPGNPQSYFTEFLPLDKVRACRAALERDADLSQYTTAASVEDLEAIRAALAYPRLNLVGSSYGTRLAMEYVRRHEANVRAVVLESPVTPATHAPEAFGRLAARALDGVIAECAATPACAQAFPALRAEAADVFARLRKGPVTALATHPASGRPAPVTLKRNHVGEAIRYMTYSSSGASAVPLYLHRAFAGDFSPFADFLIRWRSDGTFDGLYLSITCAEDVPFAAADAAERDEPTYLGSYRLREQRAACAEWPRGSRSPSQFEPVTSRVPVLIISGMLDPVTPPANGEELARTLPNALHVRVPSAGHSPAGLTGLDCLRDLERTFLERGTVAGVDAACVARIARPGFRLESATTIAR
jgi:pimeloyl-ACP methyl ester carboxylesterase